MGGATRLVTLLTSPFPPLRPCLFLLRRRISTSPHLRPCLLTLSSKFKSRNPLLLRSFHSQPNNNNNNNTQTLHSHQHHYNHPWPEWTRFLNTLLPYVNVDSGSSSSSSIIPPEDALVVYEELPQHFMLASASCLAFARSRPDLLGLLSRRDIEAVVSNGTPFLFKSALDAARRMRAFLGTDDGTNVSEFDKATTVDLMKYIISYASNPTVSSERNGLFSKELVDSSVRNLLHELVAVSSGAPASYTPAADHQLSGGHRQAFRPLGQNIEMKRGDWICSKCNFMNFARNMKCLECEESRPKKQLTGGEWECPQCNFFNYGRNSSCLRCDCRRPGAPLFNAINSRSGSGYDGDHSYGTNISSRLPETEERGQSWFNKISQLNKVSGNSSTTSDENFPEIVPSKEGENRFGVGLSKTPWERRLANSQQLQNTSNDSNAIRRDDVSITAEQNVGMEFSTSFSRSDSSDFQFHKGSNSNQAPFVPLRTDTFSRRDQTPEMESRKTETLGDNYQFPKSSSSQTDVENNEKEQSEKSERWFKKMAELHDVKDLPSAISDEDFPEIMPMRKGENRFVVSKKKDRSLTSPKYKRQVAMDQENNTNFVPFVPFPPGYFAKKDAEQPSTLDSPVKSASDTSYTKTTAETDRLDNSRFEVTNTSSVPRKDYRQMTSPNSQFSSETMAPPAGIPAQSSNTSSTIHGNTSTDRYFGEENATEASAGATSTRLSENTNVRSSWTGTSLEGSAVKETDPLDMSEEAKAERWFKRVAQIKDISELSQIPDEDFPSIMPMRKGVNRFVVSKRKTPLERRLTSQQYRRNLPIVSNDHVKKESDNS